MNKSHRVIPANRSLRRQAGVSMIELLVAFLIFSFGMLGIAGLQSKTLSYSQSSLLRSQAAALTDDILDRMRVDQANALKGSWKTDLGTPSSEIDTPGTGIYTTDLKSWKQEVERLLPDGRAQISVDGGTRFVTITIQWDDSRGRDASRQEFKTVSRL